MINPKTIENLNKFENVTYYTKQSFAYETLFQLVPNNDTREYLKFRLENEVYALTRTINFFKTKDIFNSPKFNKTVPTVNGIDSIYILCNDLKTLNNDIKDYFHQWINKFDLRNIDEFKTVIELVENKLKTFDEMLKPLSEAAVQLDLLSDNAELYSQLLPYMTHIDKNPDFDYSNSFFDRANFIITDRDFVSIIDQNYLSKFKNTSQKINYLFELTKNNMESIVANNPSVFNSKFTSKLKMLHEQGPEAVDFFNACKAELISIFKNIKGDNALPKAELYKKYLSSNGVVDFLKNKNIDDEFIDYSLDFGENVKLNKVIVFKDRSVGYIKKGEYFNVEMGDINKLEDMKYEYLESFISQQLNRKPTIRNLFINKFRDERPSSNQLSLILNNYLENEQILKNLNMHLDVFENNSFECMDDFISANVRKYKADRLLTSVLGNKYSHLYNENKQAITDVCVDLIDLDIDKSFLQNFVGKKLAAISDSDELLSTLKKLKNSLNEFDEKSLLYKLEKINIIPLEVEPNVFVFEIKNYQACKNLGSASWCIVRDEEYFNNYTSDGDRQYFIYDFNKDSSDIESMMGFTLHTNGSLITQHYKNDDYIYDSDILDKAQLTVLSDDSKYKLTPKLKGMVDDFKSINTHYSLKIKNDV